MSAAADPKAAPGEAGGKSAKAGGKKKLVLLLAPLLLGGVGAGLWFGGVLPPLLGMGKAGHAEAGKGEAGQAEAGHADSGHVAEAKAGAGKAGEGDAGAGGRGAAEAAPPPAIYVDLPEIVANLNAGPRRTGFIKLHAKLELAKAEDQPPVTAAMPRLLDMFQTYLRETRPDELRGSAGTYRLREELIARADIAAAPARIVDVLFTEMLVQ